MRRTVGRTAAIAVFLLAQAGLVSAAEIKVFSTIGVQSALEELTPKFEKTTGHKLHITWATPAILVKRVQAGESADLYILTKQSSTLSSRTIRPPPARTGPLQARAWRSS